MRGRDFLSAATYLIDKSNGTPNEANCRSAVSRAYYAAFLEARDLLAEMKIPYKRGHQSHVDVQETYEKSPFESKTGIKLHMRLQNLRTMRGKADYVLNGEHKFNYKKAQELTIEAQKLIDAVELFLTDESMREELQRVLKLTTKGKPLR